VRNGEKNGRPRGQIHAISRRRCRDAQEIFFFSFFLDQSGPELTAGNLDKEFRNGAGRVSILFVDRGCVHCGDVWLALSSRLMRCDHEKNPSLAPAPGPPQRLPRAVFCAEWDFTVRRPRELNSSAGEGLDMRLCCRINCLYLVVEERGMGFALGLGWSRRMTKEKRVEPRHFWEFGKATLV
jgi:hypothetical protein